MPINNFIINKQYVLLRTQTKIKRTERHTSLPSYCHTAYRNCRHNRIAACRRTLVRLMCTTGNGNARNCRVMPPACSKPRHLSRKLTSCLTQISLALSLSISLSLSLSLSHTHTHTNLLTCCLQRQQWGLGNKALKTIYEGAVVLILTYGAPIWVEAIRKNKNLAKYKRIQRLLNIKIAKAYRTISYDASCVIAGVRPIKITLEQRFKRVWQQKLSI